MTGISIEDECGGEIAAFFDDFNAAFATFDGGRIALKFTVPFLAHGSGGISTVLHSTADVARYFQKYLDDYRARGCVQCGYSELQVTMLGKESAIATVRWSLFDSAMSTVVSWCESYLLAVGAGMPTAFATIDHA